MMKKTITLKTLQRWINTQLKLDSVHHQEWIDGYDSALSDLQIQIDKWGGG